MLAIVNAPRILIGEAGRITDNERDLIAVHQLKLNSISWDFFCHNTVMETHPIVGVDPGNDPCTYKYDDADSYNARHLYHGRVIRESRFYLVLL